MRETLRLLAVLMLMLLLLLESNFITRDRLDLGENFKKHLTPLIFMNFWKFWHAPFGDARCERLRDDFRHFFLFFSPTVQTF